MPTLLLGALLAASAAWTVPNVFSLGFAPNGDVLVTSRARGSGAAPLDVNVRSLVTGKVVSSVSIPEVGDDVSLVSVSSDLRLAAWLDKAQDVLTVRTPTTRWSSKLQGVRGTTALTFSPDGRTLAAANSNGYVQLWDVERGERRATILLKSRPDRLAFRPDSRVLAVNIRSYEAPNDATTLWNVADGMKLGSVQSLPGFSPATFVFEPGTSMLIAEAPRYTIGWFDSESGSVSKTLPMYVTPCEQPASFVNCAHGPLNASLSRDGSRITVTVDPRDGRLLALVYDTRTLKRLYQVRVEGFAVLTPDGNSLLVSTSYPDSLSKVVLEGEVP
ncbi:WD40 repeat domain-containing protein [Deinococcus yavapaiensis]|uniref:Anaphase-promoting complex subunit 4-like WD40 domain-containing protein n=1 Tax=Deinococcus yavapaiensis KR-236 TaxID=694435 RepID=A0A318SBH0_9DEIO|nr:hypothetical protein [Deinococcus yavapaiensis]PYE53639.1 hypothetical protein DES52_108170 [Deinococcus yavapaiensis KR-236]